MTEIIKHRGRLQFITHKTPHLDELAGAEAVLRGGCRWIQLRMKQATTNEIIEMGHKMRQLCDKYEATLIIDDHVELVKEIKADGVHLGQNDMPINEARATLGEQYIIGGTANTAEQVIEHYKRGADYVGCGPFRYTTTKQNLSPILGLDGYKEIIHRLNEAQINIPVVAIGGITLNDINDIMQTLVDGIALSGAILNAPNPTDETQNIVRIINTL